MTVQRCPSCFLINPPRAMRCDCGHEFGAGPADTEEIMNAQVGPAQARVVLYGLGFVGSLFFFLFLHGKLLLFASTIFCGVRGYRAAVRLTDVRQSLREHPRPPRAQARKRRAQ
jgi:hypothetical protein